jgi:hypothetical protein
MLSLLISYGTEREIYDYIEVKIGKMMLRASPAIAPTIGPLDLKEGLGPLFQPQNNTQISTISTNCVCTQSQM